MGRDEYRRRLPGFLASFPGLRYEVVSVIEAPVPATEPSGDDRGAEPSGDDRGDEPSGSVVVEYRMTATSENRPVDIRGAMVIVVRDGLITRRTDYWDALTYLRQVDRAP